MVQKNPHPKNGQKKRHQGESPHHQGRPPPPKWVPHWPPNGYALVIQMPMSAEEYFPIWRREVPVPHVPAPIAPAPQQMQMGEDLPSLDDEGTTCWRIPEFQKAVRCLTYTRELQKEYINRLQRIIWSIDVYWLYAIEIPVILYQIIKGSLLKRLLIHRVQNHHRKTSKRREMKMNQKKRK